MASKSHLLARLAMDFFVGGLLFFGMLLVAAVFLGLEALSRLVETSWLWRAVTINSLLCVVALLLIALGGTWWRAHKCVSGASFGLATILVMVNIAWAVLESFPKLAVLSLVPIGYSVWFVIVAVRSAKAFRK